MTYKSKKIFGNDLKDIDVSVMIPTFNRAELLRKTLLSVLNQQPSGLRVQICIVSNDPSFSIESLGMVLDPSIVNVYANETNYGMVENMNRCIDLSIGKFVAFIQDDDILLPNYFSNLEKEIKLGSFERFDCLIPNRFFYYGRGNSEYVSKMKKGKAIKTAFASIVPHSCARFKQIDYLTCASVWDNCFGGGPTCGIVFTRDSLKAMRFDSSYPYSFDFVFFIEYSKEFKVGLFNKYLAVYRMESNSSQRPDVQYDFFRGELYLLQSTENTSSFVKKNKNAILSFMIGEKPNEVKAMISEEFKNNLVPYKSFKTKKFLKQCFMGLYRKKTMPKKYFYLL